MLNAHSQKVLETIAKDLPGSVLLHGPDGIGFAKAIDVIKGNRALITIQPEKDDKIDLEKGSISVEMIRELYDLVRTRVDTPRLVVLRDADRMSLAAQNAFLKLLEEPNESTHFVLLAHSPSLLLPTIRSRVQKIELRPITAAQSETLLNDLKVTDATIRSQLLFIASGLPAQLTQLAGDSKRFEARAQIIRDARTILTETRYKRLAVIEQYKERREDALLLLTDMAKLLKRSPENGAIGKIGDILKTYDRIAQNGNIRLQMAALAV